MNDKVQLAVEERKIIQDIIHNQELIRIKLIGWCIAILTGLSIAYHSEKLLLQSWKYLVFCIIIILSFLVLDIVNRKVFLKMKKRSGIVEESIQSGGKDYDGFRIEECMDDIDDNNRLIEDIRLWSPYLALLIIIICSFLAKLF